MGAETVRYVAEAGLASRIALIAPTASAARETIVEGESGILAVSPPWFRPKYEPSKRRLTWPNGVRASTFSAEEGEAARGPQHDFAWGDEPASWVDPTLWPNIKMGLRLGRSPRAVITGTPKPVPLILDFLADPRTHVTRGSTFENAGNLAGDYIRDVQRMYGGTRLGRQELFAEVLTDVAGALFNQALIDAARVDHAPDLERVVIAVDPPLTSEHGSDECGIMAAGCATHGTGEAELQHAYVLRDHSMRGKPDEWARAAVKAYYTHRADRIVAEINAGGEMVVQTIKTVDPNVPVEAVRAMRGKSKRAEPTAALYEQGRVHHVGPREQFEKLEKQMRVFTGVNGKRDDRCDSLNWAIHDLIVSRAGFAFL